MTNPCSTGHWSRRDWDLDRCDDAAIPFQVPTSFLRSHSRQHAAAFLTFQVSHIGQSLRLSEVPLQASH